MPHWPKPLGFSKQKNNHANVIKALEYIGNPQDKLQNIIHIAGTNGKGSTLAFIKQILLDNNYTVNCYTSPHLINFNEQIFLKNDYISDGDLRLFFEEVRLKLDNNFNLTFFESTTIATIYIFSQIKADFNLIETGLGGRIDATNIFKSKLLAILSPVSYDHMEYLGNNLIQITCEKADILLNAEQVIIAKQKPIVNACLKIIFMQNHINAAKFFKQDYDFDTDDEKFHYIDITSETITEYKKPTLVGCHQFINLATALTATNYISTKYNLNFNQTKQAIVNTKWHGRLEKIKISNKLLTNKHSEIYFDGAHNEQGARYLALWLKQNQFAGETILIYGRTKNKDHNKFLKKFRNVIKKIYLVEVQNEPTPATISEMKNVIKLDHFTFYSNNDIHGAIIEAQKLFSTQNVALRIICCGSLFLYRDLKHFF